jgi:hypothetical protein
MLALFAPVLGACSDMGDLGRRSPSLLSRTYDDAAAAAQRMAGLEESYDLPLTAAEDALRTRHEDLRALARASLVSRMLRKVRGGGEDGFGHIEALTGDIEVERERFGMFVKAARRVMLIDAARLHRLEGLSAIKAARQRRAVRARARENSGLIRHGVRLMRRHVGLYRRHLAALPIEWPDVPLAGIESAFDKLNNDVIGFHAELDEKAYQRLAHGGDSYK